MVEPGPDPITQRTLSRPAGNAFQSVDTRAVQLLRSARDLVRRGWTQQAEGRDAQGTAGEPWQPTATSWSLLGALVAALEEQTDGRKELPLVQLADALDALALFV